MLAAVAVKCGLKRDEPLERSVPVSRRVHLNHRYLFPLIGPPAYIAVDWLKSGEPVHDIQTHLGRNDLVGGNNIMVFRLFLFCRGLVF